MAIAKNPKRNTIATTDIQAEAFILGANQQQPNDDRDPNKKPIQVRIDPEILARIDRAAKRLGISRSAFIVSSAAERLERME